MPEIGTVGGWVRRELDWELEPVEVLRLVRDDPYPVALIGDWAGGGAVIASRPTQIRTPPDPLADVLDQPFPPGQAGGGFGGGWIGYLGYGAAHQFLTVPPAPGGPRQLPDWWFGFYDQVLRFDAGSGRWFFEALLAPGDDESAADHPFRLMLEKTKSDSRKPRDYRCGDFVVVPSEPEHREAVRRTVGLIRDGDIFQANICLRLEAGFAGDPLDLFCAGVSRLRPPFAAFLRTGGGAVASLSPELFLRRAGREVLTQPIKGTVRRSAEPDRAGAQRRELEASAKNRAENVMIVDLMRNDLGRVCAAGTVAVPRLLHAQAHPGLWHLVSDVTGTLAPGCGDGDLIRATFPPGSITGAPKVRAMEVIHELEAVPREVYTGAIGYRSPVAGLELNVAIRTFEFRDERVWLGAGGGIVADSRDDDEYAECLIKAGPLIRAVGGTLAGSAGGVEAGDGSAGDGIPAGLRPRAALGVFTSLLVEAGAVRDLEAHLDRLATSALEQFGKGLPTSLGEDLAACLAGQPSGRLRITVKPVGGPLQVRVEVVPLEPNREPVGGGAAAGTGAAGRAVRLWPATVPGGLGAHKWADRRLLGMLLSTLAPSQPGPSDQVLIEDVTGEVLETDRANVFAVIDGVLWTPAADGRLLPGVARAAVLRAAAEAGVEVRTGPLTQEDLTGASEVFLTNSVRGVQAVGYVAGLPAAGAGGPVTRRVSSWLVSRPTRLPGVPTPGQPGVPTPGQPGTRRPHRASGPGLGSCPGSDSNGPANGPRVVLVDNYDSFTYNLAQLLIGCGCVVDVVRNDELTAAEIIGSRPDAIVISPGPCAPPEAGVSVEVVRVCPPGTPILGICLGHQVIAAAFGASIVRAPEPVHGRTSPIRHDGLGVFAGLPQGFPATRYHSLIIAEKTLPDFLPVTGRTPEGVPMAVRHRSLPIEGVQFHPESILTGSGARLIGNFISLVRPESSY